MVSFSKAKEIIDKATGGRVNVVEHTRAKQGKGDPGKHPLVPSPCIEKYQRSSIRGKKLELKQMQAMLDAYKREVEREILQAPLASFLHAMPSTTGAAGPS